MTNFPLLGKDKFPLGVEYIFESKFSLVVRIGLVGAEMGKVLLTVWVAWKKKHTVFCF